MICLFEFILGVNLFGIYLLFIVICVKLVEFCYSYEVDINLSNVVMLFFKFVYLEM